MPHSFSLHILFHGVAGAACSCRGTQNVPCAQQIVRSAGESECPVFLGSTFMSGLTQQGAGLEPAKDLFCALSFSLAHLVAVVASRWTIDCTAAARVVLSEMWCHIQRTEWFHKVMRIISFVGTKSEALGLLFLLQRFEHSMRSLTFGFSCCLRITGSHDQPWRLSVITFPMNESFDSLPAFILCRRASGYAVDSCVSFARFLPCQLMVGLSGSSESEDERFPLFWKLICRAPR